LRGDGFGIKASVFERSRIRASDRGCNIGAMETERSRRHASQQGGEIANQTTSLCSGESGCASKTTHHDDVRATNSGQNTVALSSARAQVWRHDQGATSHRHDRTTDRLFPPEHG
jgi:hypothetical protein